VFDYKKKKINFEHKKRLNKKGNEGVEVDINVEISSLVCQDCKYHVPIYRKSANTVLAK